MSSYRIKLTSAQIYVASSYFIYAIITATESSEIRNLVGKLAPENPISHVPCRCEVDSRNFLKPELAMDRHNSLLTKKNSRPLGRSVEEDPQERRERINESMARFMQLLTFFGHVDNFLTQKTQGLIKIMGKAVETNEDEEEEYPTRRYRSIKHNPPKIVTTITS